MPQLRHSISVDSQADAFRERPCRLFRRRRRILGADVHFESDSRELLALVDTAYGGLPPHTLAGPLVELHIRLRLMPRAPQPAAEPPRVQTQSGAGLLCGVMDSANYVVLRPEDRSALVVISNDMLERPYYPRYELIEFAVFTLAARVCGLVPLHGACVGRDGRGLLLLGASGAGKSTLAMLSLLRGLEFVAEDAVFVQPRSLLATGVANFLHVCADAGVAPWIASAPVIRRRSGVEKFEVDLRRRGLRLAATPLRLIGTVFVSGETAQNADMLLSPVAAASIAARLAADQPYAATQPGWREFVQRLSRMQVLELRRGRDPQASVDALAGLLG